MNLNYFAKKITLKEGKKESLSIAQVKEVIKIVLGELSVMDLPDLQKLLKRYRKLPKTKWKKGK